MKKVLAIILLLLVVITTFGCTNEQSADIDTTVAEIVTEVTENTEPIALEGTKFPKGTSIYGVDVSEMDKSAAFAALKAAVSDYSLELTVNGKAVILNADELALSASKEKFDAFFESLSLGEALMVPELLTYNEDNITKIVTARCNTKAKNASIEYNAAAGAFKIMPATNGTEIDPGPAVEAVKKAIATLKLRASATVETTELKPTITEKSAEAQNGLNKANSYLKLDLKYTYAPEGVSAKTVALTKADFASFVSFNEKLSPSISKAFIETYAYDMNSKYNVPGENGKFVTTGGETINVEVTYAGQQVDIEALRDDIYYCVTNNIGGTRTAPYLDRTAMEDMSFGGNYVEVDMSSQQLWVYRNGKCVVSTPVVTGCAYTGMTTPQGVYKINNKMRNAKLESPEYITYVDYWMAFIGNGYGLHDASWRPYSEFGGDTYLYNGSHGCVNIPYSVMPDVYANAGVGTHVILYGGATKADPVKQVLTGTDKVSATLSKTFKLDVKQKYPVGELTYAVEDSSVLTVSKNGTVTPKAVGTTTVTVTSPKQSFYTKATFKVTITVNDPCADGNHSCKTWTVSKPATCTAAGIKSGTCSKCGKTVTREIPATGHSFSSDQEFCLNGCGTKNPNYVAPTEPVTTAPNTTVTTEAATIAQ